MCWRSDHRARVLCIAYISMATALLGSGIVAAGFTIYAYTPSTKEKSKYNIGGVLETVMPTALAVNIIHHVVSISLACGAQQEKHTLLLPWLGATALAIVAALLGVAGMAIKEWSAPYWTAPLVLWAVLNGYFWHDVLQFYKGLRERADRRRELQTRTV